MGNFEKIRLREVNSDSMLDELLELLKDKQNNSTQIDAEEANERDIEALKVYWEAKESTDPNVVTPRFNKLFSDWNKYSAQLQSILLADMIVNGNSRTEFFLNRRDEYIKENNPYAEKHYVLTNASADYYNRKLDEKNNKILPMNHMPSEKGRILFSSDIKNIRENILENLLKKIGFNEDEINHIESKLILFANQKSYFKEVNVSEITQFIYAAKNLRDCLDIAEKYKSQYFNKETIIHNIRDNINTPYKFIIGQDSKVTLTRINLFRFLEENDLSKRLFFRNPSDYYRALLLREDKFYSDIIGYGNEIEKTMGMYSYQNVEGAPSIPFDVFKHLYAYSQEVPIDQRRRKDKEFTRLFLNYNFGEASKWEELELEKKYDEVLPKYNELNDEQKRNVELIDAPSQIADDAIAILGKRFGSQKEGAINYKNQKVDIGGVDYYIFETNGYTVLEPLEVKVGYSIIADASLQEMISQENINAENIISSLKKEHKAFMVDRFDFDKLDSFALANRLQLISETISSSVKDTSKSRHEEGLTMRQIVEKITREVPVKSIPDAASYLYTFKGFMNIGETPGIRKTKLDSIKNYIDQIEEEKEKNDIEP